MLVWRDYLILSMKITFQNSLVSFLYIVRADEDSSSLNPGDTEITSKIQ